MKVFVKDLTDQLLVFALPMLDALLKQGWEVRLSSKDAHVAGIFNRLNGKIRLQNSDTPVDEEWTTVLLWNVLDFAADALQGNIIFPIIPAARAVEYPRAVNDVLWTPLSDHSVLGYRMGDVPSLIDFVYYLNHARPLRGKRVLITGGPTAEDIDPVRFITNRSSGKMGLALARAAFVCGAEVTLILGPSALNVPKYLSCIHVRSAQQMAEAVFKHFDQSDVYIGAAAIADFKPLTFSPQKIKKKSEKPGLQLSLTRTTDILTELNRRKKQQLLIGFSVETEKEIEHSKEKLQRKGLDCIIINNPKHKGAAFGQETNKVQLLSRSGEIQDWPLMNKFQLSLRIMETIARLKEDV
ncbi:phosphopantothenoylcysteine decarboxylase domain-containing protein [Caldithrix abyssi]